MLAVYTVNLFLEQKRKYVRQIYAKGSTQSTEILNRSLSSLTKKKQQYKGDGKKKA